MQRLHIIGGKDHGKTKLIVDLVKEFTRRGLSVGTIKHTHHHHELDVPGKDSYRHRLAGATVVGILSQSMCAVFFPTDTSDDPGDDHYSSFAPMFTDCRLVLVEGDSATCAPKIEVWRKELQTPPLAFEDQRILAVVTDDDLNTGTEVLRRSDVARLSDWIFSKLLDKHSAT